MVYCWLLGICAGQGAVSDSLSPQSPDGSRDPEGMRVVLFALVTWGAWVVRGDKAYQHGRGQGASNGPGRGVSSFEGFTADTMIEQRGQISGLIHQGSGVRGRDSGLGWWGQGLHCERAALYLDWRVMGEGFTSRVRQEGGWRLPRLCVKSPSSGDICDATNWNLHETLSVKCLAGHFLGHCMGPGQVATTARSASCPHGRSDRARTQNPFLE